MAQVQYLKDSEIGPLYLVASEKGLRGIFWKRQAAPLVTQLEGTSPEMINLSLAARELSEYLTGKRKHFNVALDVEGTDFQQKVWEELRRIPYGRTISYKELALRVSTAGVRAVGTANGRNPLCIIVPCHRVIGSDGGLGGYSGGLDMKKRLLAIEQGDSQ